MRETPMQRRSREARESNIKWGKYIAVERYSGAIGRRIVEHVCEVTKLTPTQVVAGRARFWRTGVAAYTNGLSRDNARPATKKEYDAYCAKKNADAAERDKQNQQRQQIEESPENKLVSEILNDWDPNRREQLRGLGERQLTLIVALLQSKRSDDALDRLYAADLRE